MNWFAQVVNARLKEYFPEKEMVIEQEQKKNWLGKFFNQKSTEIKDPTKLIAPSGTSNMVIELPDLTNETSVYAEFV